MRIGTGFCSRDDCYKNRCWPGYTLRLQIFLRDLDSFLDLGYQWPVYNDIIWPRDSKPMRDLRSDNGVVYRTHDTSEPEYRVHYLDVVA
jgi:hypothetical protein